MRALEIAERHKLRIKAKNLRYAIEFFAGIFPDETTAKRREAALVVVCGSYRIPSAASMTWPAREALIANGHDLGEHAALLASKQADVQGCSIARKRRMRASPR